MTIRIVVRGKANPDRVNGVNKVVDAHARHLRLLGNDVEVWGITPDPDSPTSEREYPLRLFRARRWFLPLDPGLLSAIHGSKRETIFHLHSAFLPELCRVAAQCARLGLRSVWSPHGAYLPGAMRRSGFSYLKKLLWLGLVERRLLKGTWRVHLVSGAELDPVRKLTSVPACVVPNGVDVDRIQPCVRARQPGGGMRFLYLGRYDAHHKGLDRLVTAFSRHVESHPHDHLTCHGSGPDLEYLRSLVGRSAASASISLEGPVFGDAKWAAMSRHDIFVHASRWDAFPTTCVEAAAAGMPLVLTPFGDLSDIVREYRAGFVQPWLTLFEGIEEIADHFSEYSANARRMVEERLDWPILVSRLINDVYTTSDI